MKNFTAVDFNNIKIITIAKVGSSSFLYSLKNKYSVEHGHSILKIKDVIERESNTLIICGIRNPLDRNLSYLFQTFDNHGYNDVKVDENEYKGENCYICEKAELLKMGEDEIIEEFFKKDYHLTFNYWFNEFFNITGINQYEFDKEKGYKIYNYKNNNTLLMYTLEKLNQNKKELCSIFKIRKLKHTNNSSKRYYKKIYSRVKNKIKFTKDYKDSLLDTEIMKYFYNDYSIHEFYNKYGDKL